MKKCRRGHEFTPDNTYVDPSSGRQRCQECRRIYRGQYKPAPKALPVDWDEFLDAYQNPEDGWWEQAACSGEDTALFFPSNNEFAVYMTAISVCAECPVRIQCLAANVSEEHGVFGGTGQGWRKEARKKLRRRGLLDERRMTWADDIYYSRVRDRQRARL